jgi:molybdopterin molybdotransferase
LTPPPSPPAKGGELWSGASESGSFPPDVRLVGFANRTPLRDALAWIDAHAGMVGSETIAIEDAAGRISAAPVISQMDWPNADRAGVDGYAMRAANSEGAGDYNPLPLTLADMRSTEALPPGSVLLATTGTQLPSGADAILPFEAARQSGPGMLDVLAPVARGAGVDRRGSELGAGTEAVAGSKQLRPQDIALLAAIGATRVAVLRKPLVRLVVAGPKAAEPDALTLMLRALVARDGGIGESAPSADATWRDDDQTTLTQAVARSVAGADLVLVAGRSGTGLDDEAPLAITQAGGTLDMHGIALRPGDSAGLGLIGGVPVLLLPGAPLACLAAYDVLAARAVRCLAGFSLSLAYPVVDATLDRKIVSAIGFTDLVRVRMARGCAAPLGSADQGGLASAVRADGFVIVPETSEGYPPGSSVRVHLYDDQRRELPYE